MKENKGEIICEQCGKHLRILRSSFLTTWNLLRHWNTRIPAAQPSKVQEKDRYWIDQYILRGEKIIEMEKEIQRLKELITGQAYSIWKGCGSDLSFDEWNKQFISGNNL